MFEQINSLINEIHQLEKQRHMHLTSISIHLAKLVHNGLIADCMVLGKHVWQIPANDTTMTDVLGYVYQPALKTSQGLGLVIWKALDYLDARDHDKLEIESESRFRIMWSCVGFHRLMALREYEELFSRVESGEY